MAKLIVKDSIIRTLARNGIDYICITDIARQKNPDESKDIVKNWMRAKNTLEYLGLRESLNNPLLKWGRIRPHFKRGLFNDSRNPRYSRVFFALIQFFTISLDSSGFF